MTLPVNIFIDPTQILFDWCLETEHPTESHVIEIDQQYFLPYDYRSAGSDNAAWLYCVAPNTDTPLFAPGKLKLDIVLSLTGMSTPLTLEVLLSISEDSLTNAQIVSDILVKSFQVNNNAFGRLTDVIDLSAILNNETFQHGKRYKAHIQIVARNNNEIAGISPWIESQHILHVNTQAPVVSIAAPDFVWTQNAFEAVVVGQEQVIIDFVTNVSSEVIFFDDYNYPDGCELPVSPGHMVSISGTKHQIVIQNPDITTTNGVRFSIAARDIKYKNISQHSQGQFCYNVLFAKKETIVPDIAFTETPTSNIVGFYPLSNTLHFAGTHAQAGAIQLELWQAYTKKTAIMCSIDGNNWTGNFENLADIILEDEVLIKAIATSHTTNTKEIHWTGHLLKNPQITIGQPMQNNMTYAQPTVWLQGHIVNSLGYLQNDSMILTVYPQGSSVAIFEKEIVVDAVGMWGTYVEQLNSGQYTVRAAVQNILNYSHSSERVFTISLSAPTIQILTPVTDFYQSLTDITVSGNHTDATDITIELWKNSILFVRQTATIIDQRWYANFANLNHGQFDIKAIASNAVSQLSHTTWSSFHVDLQPPDINISSIVGKNANNNEENFAITPNVTVYGNIVLIMSHANDIHSGVASYTIKNNDEIIRTITTESRQTSLSMLETLELVDAQNKIEIFYTDNVGNTGKAKIDGQDALHIEYIPYNAFGPVIVINSPANNSWHATNTINVAGIYSDMHGVSEVLIEVAQANTKYLTITDVNITHNAWQAIVTGLRNGANTITVWGKDGLGLTSDTPATLDIMIDAMAPIIHVVNASPITNVAEYTFITTALDHHSGIAKYVVELENEQIERTVVASQDFAPAIAPNILVTQEKTLELPRGTNRIFVSYQDVLGNIGAQIIEVIYEIIDTSAPTISINTNNAHLSLPCPINIEVSDPESSLIDYSVDFYPYLATNEVANDSMFYRIGKIPMLISENMLLPTTEVSKCNSSAFFEIEGLEQYITNAFTFQTGLFIQELATTSSIFVWGNQDKKETLELGLTASGDHCTLWFKMFNGLGQVDSVVSVETVPLRQWCLVAFTVMNNELQLFINNKLCKKANLRDTMAPATRIFCRISEGDAIVYYSNVKIWSCALSQENFVDEVLSDLIGHWEFLPDFSNNVCTEVSLIAHNVEFEKIIPATKQTGLALTNVTYIEGASFFVDIEQGLNFDIDLQLNNSLGNLIILAGQQAELTVFINDKQQLGLTFKQPRVNKTVLSNVPVLFEQRININITMSPDGVVYFFQNNQQIGYGVVDPISFISEQNSIGAIASGVDLILYRYKIWRQQNASVEIDYTITSDTRILDSSEYQRNGQIIGAQYQTVQSVFIASVDFDIGTSNPLEQTFFAHFQNSYRLNNNTHNFYSAHSYTSNTVATEHLCDGTHTVKVTAVNKMGLVTTAYKTFAIVTQVPEAYILPADNTLILPMSEIQLVFSRPMNTSSVEQNLYIDPKLTDGKWIWNDTKECLTYIHNELFAVGNIVQVWLKAGAKDAVSGQRVMPLSASYIVSDDMTTRIWGTVPANGQKDVAITSSLMLFFSQSIAIESIVANVTVQVINTKTLQPEILNTEFTIEHTNGLRFSFATELMPGTTYQVIISNAIQDSMGVFLDEPYVFDFTTKEYMGDWYEYSMPVFNGMNGIAIPLSNGIAQYTNITLRNFLEKQLGVGKVGALFWYNTVIKKWVGDLLGTSMMKTFDHYDGAFVVLNLTTPHDINFAGYIIASGTVRVHLKQGLNLISIPLDINVNNIKSLLGVISEQIGQTTIVSYINRRQNLAKKQEELIGYTYIENISHDAIDFRLDRLGGDALAIIVENDCSFLITGNAWKN